MNKYPHPRNENLSSLDTALLDAVITDNTRAVQNLLEAGANPNCYEDAAKIRPLHFAAANQCYSVIPLLLLAGADLYEQNQWDGLTPLEIARTKQDDKMIELLIESPQIKKCTYIN